MALLFTNTDCGPSNPLQGLSKHFERDRGIQQDHFGSGAGPAREQNFRIQGSPVSSEDRIAASRFFAQHQAGSPNAFDLSALQTHLPAQASRFTSSWASEFQIEPSAKVASTRTAEPSSSPAMNTLKHNDASSWTPALYTHAPRPMLPLPAQVQVSHEHSTWDREFESRLASVTQTAEAVEQKGGVQDSDELSRTAGLLLETMKDEQNPKFKNSVFMTLMQKLRDRQVIVEGNEMVENHGLAISPPSSNVKGKGKAVDNTTPLPSSFVPDRNGHILDIMNQTEGKAERLYGEDEYWRQENASYIDYWSQAQKPRQPENSSWHHLQDDWDQFEATSTGIRPLDMYQFQSNNPYLNGESSKTVHLMHDIHQIPESVLELESIVQRNLSDASAWFQLGVKQQENERERKALQALGRAIELDPSHLPSWLALAVSHTNDGNRAETYRSIREWVQRNERYQAIVRRYPEDISASYTERLTSLVDCLVQMARSSLNGDLDADIQIALAVLFNVNEDYSKAQDCFRAALGVRPQDWLLYNRVGATMANSGQPNQAIQYYERALELNPVYIRARYNLGIACINLRQYGQAAQHIVNALILQNSDGARDSSDLTSKALWNSLKTACVHLGRPDLSSLCDTNDIDQFLTAFNKGDV